MLVGQFALGSCSRGLDIRPASIRRSSPTAIPPTLLAATHVGTEQKSKLAAFYRLVASGDVTNQLTERKPEPSGKGAKPTTARRENTTSRPKKVAGSDAGSAAETASVEKRGEAPSLHIDVQVHIPPDATAEQIDVIFAAMAKHLYKR